MGCTNSKTEKDEALRLCRERKRFIKLAIDSRYALATAHVSYVQSLRNVGIALRRYAEAEALIESSLSISDKTPSQSTYPSPSPSNIADVSESPLHNESAFSPPMATVRYMRSGGNTAMTVRINPCNKFLDDESAAFRMPPPPPPPESEASWDFFDPIDNGESFRFMGHAECKDEKFNSILPVTRNQWGDVGFEGNHELYGHSLKSNLDEKFIVKGVESCQQTIKREDGQQESLINANGLNETVADKAALGRASSKSEKTMTGKTVCAEREDPSEFITHRAKDFLSSIKDIEHRFIRASESGKEISRMLESSKIKVEYSEAKGKSFASALSTAFQLVCCGKKATFVSHEPAQKIIRWKRTASSRSSSSKNPLATTSKEDIDDSGSDFIEEFCMISGSHSSTLDRLYAWEIKLYDEVKASESIKKEYDRKCDQLRHQCAKDQGTQVIDKTRSVVKDLHSRIRVAIHSVDTISKRIEKMRDEELHPQLVELTQGLIRMWKAMLECHHSQYITISLAYHSRSSTGTLQGDTRREILSQLQEEIECFGLSFANWINSLASYAEALNGWLQICILQPRERSKSRRPFSPRRVLAPPIFVLCRDWSAGIKDLPSEELSQAIKSFLSDLYHLIELQEEQLSKKQNLAHPSTGDSESKTNEGINDDDSANLCCIHTSLSKVLDRLTKFSEASLKMYEDIRQKNEAARNAYHNCRYFRPETI